MDKGYYELLGVSQSADPQTLRKAFHILSKALHPDTTLLPVDEAATKFRKVYEAYELLSDPLRRKLYDQELQDKANKLKTFDIGVKTKINSAVHKKSYLDSRRPFSGGELFSLSLLCIALLISVFLSIGFALVDGREWQVNPSWLATDQSLAALPQIRISNVITTFSNNSFKSALVSIN